MKDEYSAHRLIHPNNIDIIELNSVKIKLYKYLGLTQRS